MKHDITHNGIMGNINQIIREGIFPFLKRLENNSRYKRDNSYIFLDKNDDLNIYLSTIRVRKQKIGVAIPWLDGPPSKKATPQPTPQPTTQVTPQATQFYTQPYSPGDIPSCFPSSNVLPITILYIPIANGPTGTVPCYR